MNTCPMSKMQAKQRETMVKNHAPIRTPLSSFWEFPNDVEQMAIAIIADAVDHVLKASL